ncbi:gliding motility-associated ABC transporter permease subunit GldF [Zhouia sp. PK063]|uniref:gliding motility-associated ABC transporter permease subunit GldF n=1 Tax=Zhouia sp. PK063 TaxID=3373602 RepID=UPI0037B0CBF9
MFAILKREISSFFSSAVGYLVIAVFLVINGLFLWIFNGDFNILNSGIAGLNGFFTLAPWVFLFLIPAITMKSFSEEIRLGTLEILLTKPLSHTEIILGKFFGAFILVLIALLPTILYVYTIYELGNPTGNLDWGVTIGSYFSLCFLMLSYVGIGIFASTLSENQIVSFIIAVIISFFLYYGFDALANLESFSSINLWVMNLGMKVHFDNISLGVIALKDVVYFISIAFLFLAFTQVKLKHINQ